MLGLLSIVCHGTLPATTDAIQAPDSLVSPLWTDTTAETELVIFPPPDAKLPLWFQIAWGDGSQTDWTGPLQSMTDISRYHKYTVLGDLAILVRCRDSLGRKSAWSQPLKVTVGEPLLKWQFPSAYPIVASPTLDLRGNVYVGDDTGFVYCVSPDGELRWYFETRAPVYAAVVVVDSAVYVASHDSSLYCLDLGGRKRWSVDLRDELYTAPAVGPDGTLYIGTGAGTLYAVTPAGKVRWSFKAGDEISSSPTVGADGRVYFCADSVYCFDAKGRRRWAFGAPNGDYFFAAPVPDTNGLTYAGNFDGYLYCLGPNGRLLWRAPTTDDCEIRSETAFDLDGSLWFGSDAEYLFRKDPGGSPRDVYEAIDVVVATPAVSDKGSVYCLPDDGTLVGFTRSGRLLLKLEVASGDKDVYYTSAPTIGPDGTIYVGSWDGGLYALRGDGPPATTVWPQHRRDAQHTGRVRK
jgi:outer membrane protein assembly factor BamB